MKMAKKFLAVALAGVLALSVLTGCANGVKSKDVADSLTKMGIKVEQSKDVDKTAKETLKAIEAIIDAKTNADLKDDNAAKIKLSNAVEKTNGKVIKETTITDTTNKVQKALGVFANGSDAEKANAGKQIRVALVQAQEGDTTNGKKVVEPGKLGTATTKDGKYMLVVIVNEMKADA